MAQESSSRTVPGSYICYYRARYYDSQIGRFISEDPAGPITGGLNLYAYVSNGSPNFMDPTGLEQLKDCPENCARANRTKLRLKLKTTPTRNLQGYEINYELTGMNPGESYVVFQAESNHSRGENTPHGPGSYGDAPNVFNDQFGFGALQQSSDSVQTFYAIPVTWSKNRNGGWEYRERGPGLPILVQDLNGDAFCQLAVWFDIGQGGFATINGNLVTEKLRSFLAPGGRTQ